MKNPPRKCTCGGSFQWVGEPYVYKGVQFQVELERCVGCAEDHIPAREFHRMEAELADEGLALHEDERIARAKATCERLAAVE